MSTIEGNHTFEKITDVNEKNIDDVTIFVFDEYEMEYPEISGMKDGRVYLSDYQSGIVKYKDGGYVRLYHKSEKSIGQFQYGLKEI